MVTVCEMRQGLTSRQEWELMWTCPKCERQFGKPKQQHECAPALTVEEYFESGPDFERPIFEVVRDHLRTLDEDVYFEPVSVGIFFKRRSTFAQLRTMTKWVAVCFNLTRKLESKRLSRKVVAHGEKFYHVVNITSADEIDDQLLDWLAEAWSADEPYRTDCSPQAGSPSREGASPRVGEVSG